MNTLSTQTVQTMSSIEIAELCGKRHDNVVRDIKTVLEQAGINALKFEGVYTDKKGEQRPCYYLPRFECDLVISGYNVKYRAAIIQRWHELEQALSPAELLVQQAQAFLRVEREQAAQRKEIDAIKSHLEHATGGTDYSTIRAYGKLRGIPMPLCLANAMGREAAKRARAEGVPIGKVSDERWGTTNTYPTALLDELFYGSQSMGQNP